MSRSKRQIEHDSILYNDDIDFNKYKKQRTYKEKFIYKQNRSMQSQSINIRYDSTKVKFCKACTCVFQPQKKRKGKHKWFCTYCIEQGWHSYCQFPSGCYNFSTENSIYCACHFHEFSMFRQYCGKGTSMMLTLRQNMGDIYPLWKTCEGRHMDLIYSSLLQDRLEYVTTDTDQNKQMQRDIYDLRNYSQINFLLFCNFNINLSIHFTRGYKFTIRPNTCMKNLDIVCHSLSEKNSFVRFKLMKEHIVALNAFMMRHHLNQRDIVRMDCYFYINIISNSNHLAINLFDERIDYTSSVKNPYEKMLPKNDDLSPVKIVPTNNTAKQARQKVNIVPMDPSGLSCKVPRAFVARPTNLGETYEWSAFHINDHAITTYLNVSCVESKSTNIFHFDLHGINFNFLDDFGFYCFSSVGEKANVCALRPVRKYKTCHLPMQTKEEAPYNTQLFQCTKINQNCELEIKGIHASSKPDPKKIRLPNLSNNSVLRAFVQECLSAYSKKIIDKINCNVDTLHIAAYPTEVEYTFRPTENLTHVFGERIRLLVQRTSSKNIDQAQRVTYKVIQLSLHDTDRLQTQVFKCDLEPDYDIVIKKKNSNSSNYTPKELQYINPFVGSCDS